MTTFTNVPSNRRQTGDGADLLSFEAWRHADHVIALCTAYLATVEEYEIKRDELRAVFGIALDQVAAEAFGRDEPYEGDSK